MTRLSIKNILVPVDFTETSENAVDHAAILAKGINATLTLLNVIEQTSEVNPMSLEVQSMTNLATEQESATKPKMRDLQDKILQKHGVRIITAIATGHIYTEILNYIKEYSVDLVVMGTHGASGYKEMFIGSNAQRVVTLADIPVLTLQKHGTSQGFRNILIPIDNSIHSREKVNLAMVLAGLFNSKIHIIGLPDSDDADEMKKFRVKINSVEELVKEEGLQYTNTTVHDDSLAKAALKYAQENNCDLIVINTGHESKITGIFLGAFAQQIVNHSDIPVLSIKHLEDHYEIETPGFGI